MERQSVILTSIVFLCLAGRCISCEECERVCPMDIPLTLMNRMLEKEIKAGTEVEAHGSWNTEAISNMEDFAKIRFVTKDEFDKM